MAIYTKIPENNIAGVLGKSLGKVAGGIGNNASITLQKVEEDLQDAVARLSTITQEELSQIIFSAESRVKTVSASLGSLESSIGSTKSMSKTLKAPIPLLENTIKVIKMLPMLQMWLSVSFTTVFSDILEMTAETVAQLKEIGDSIEDLVSVLENVLDPIKKQIEQINRLIAMLKARKAIVDDSVDKSDQEKLTNLGFYDSEGNSLLDTLLTGMTGGSGGSGGVGGSGTGTQSTHGGGSISNYGNSSVDLSSIDVQNKVLLSKPGDTVEVLTLHGDYLSTIYIQSEKAPDKPLSREPVPEGWSEVPLPEPCWITSATVSGQTGKVREWTEVKKYVADGREKRGTFSSENGRYGTEQRNNGEDGSVNSKNKVKILGVEDIRQLDTSRRNTLAGILKIASENEAYTLLKVLVDKLDKSSVSRNTKESIRNTLNEMLNRSIGTIGKSPGEGNGKVAKTLFVGPDGTEYTLEVVVDPGTAIALQRYVIVREPGGTIVLEGEKSFSTNTDILISEMKIRLSNLLS